MNLHPQLPGARPYESVGGFCLPKKQSCGHWEIIMVYY